MRTGTSYMGHQDPAHLAIDFREMAGLQLDDVLLAVQEVDFVWFPGVLEHTPKVAADHGIRPLVCFWGALNLFGGGRSSYYLLEHPDGFQVARDGSHRANGCYNNPGCRDYIRSLIDRSVECGFQGYFIDEPTPLKECFCPSCVAKYEAWHGADLRQATDEEIAAFWDRCVVDYVAEIAAYCKKNHPGLETWCCVMPSDKSTWEGLAALPELDNLGTDLYWVNKDRDVEEMRPYVRELDAVCRSNGKEHHEWFQCWRVQKGREHRIIEQGKVLIEEKPGSIFVWAWKGQLGTREACEDPAAAWAAASEVFRMAKE